MLNRLPGMKLISSTIKTVACWKILVIKILSVKATFLLATSPLWFQFFSELFQNKPVSW